MSDLPPIGPEYDDSATRTNLEVGHRRKIWPNVEPMRLEPEPAPRAKLRLGRVGLLAGAITLTAIIVGAAIFRPAPDPVEDVSVAAATATAAAVIESAAAAATEAATVPTVEPTTAATTAAGTEPAEAKTIVPPLPAGSGSGRRIVFDQSDQRVWLIEENNAVERSYLVSGSRFDNLQPGTYSVQSKQRQATSFDYTGTMEYFVRFATGYRAPIGFHAIPIYNNGEMEQTVEQLGTPLSAGCVRQEKSDAKYLWDWAPIGTKVVVTA